MIDFKEYQSLIKKEARSMLSGLDQQKVWKFTGSQPQECPKCGVQVFDPFGFKRVIHDIVACSLRNACSECGCSVMAPSKMCGTCAMNQITSLP